MEPRLFNKNGSPKKHSFVIIAVAGCLLLCSVFLCCFLLHRSRLTQAPETFFFYLQQADRFYAESNTAKAVKQLAASKKYALSSANWLSIIKRFYRWHFPAEAAESAREASSLFPGNETIAFVSSFMQLQNLNAEAALQYARPLTSGGGSVLNAFLQITQLPPRSRDPAVLAAAGTYANSPLLTENAAVLYVMQESFSKAVPLMPAYYRRYTEIQELLVSGDKESARQLYQTLASSRPEFWLTVLYDSGDPAQTYALASLITQTERLSGINPGREILSLQADASFVSGDRENAFAAWHQLASFYPAYKPEIWYNLARLSHSDGEQFAFIDTLLSFFPDYVPALRMAAVAAIDRERTENHDPVERALYNAGMKTVDMAQKESRVYVNKTLAKKYFTAAYVFLEKNALPLSDGVALEHKRFEWAFEPPANALIDIWRLLEQYPDSELVNHYAVWLFCANERNADARLVLENWLAENEMKPWISPWLGFLAATDGDLDDAETCFRTAAGSFHTAWQLFANIAVIEEAHRNWDTAVDLFTLASTHTDSVAVQSDLHYRIGKILVGRRNYQGARTALQYALDLNPDNYSAKVLLMPLQ